MLKQFSLLSLGTLFVMYCLTVPVVWGGTVKLGDQVGNLEFGKPLTPADQKYLGLAKDAPFTLNEIGAPYLLLEIFGTNCSHCIAQAPIMNNLYNLVQQDAKLGSKVKFLSVGAGDNQFKVTMFRKFYKVPFPVLPDPDTKIIEKVEILGTPTSLLLNKKGKVIELHVGAIESAEGFFKKLKAHVK